jgi:DNA-binding response OmpR family regulator
MTQSHPVKIAIVEDDIVISQMYRMKFESEGFEVQTAENGKLGVELCEKYQPDMLLLDLRMPEMGGEEALQKIRATDWGKRTPVIILTNLGEEEAPDSLRALGIHSYIVKAELTPSQVVERIKQALAGKQAPAAA